MPSQHGADGDLSCIYINSVPFQHTDKAAEGAVQSDNKGISHWQTPKVFSP